MPYTLNGFFMSVVFFSVDIIFFYLSKFMVTCGTWMCSHVFLCCTASSKTRTPKFGGFFNSFNFTLHCGLAIIFYYVVNVVSDDTLNILYLM